MWKTITQLNKENLDKLVFYLLIIFLPINLGKHFEILDSYVWGFLSDYLIPTVYVQDILVFRE